jgi:hypothetical protein
MGQPGFGAKAIRNAVCRCVLFIVVVVVVVVV